MTASQTLRSRLRPPARGLAAALLIGLLTLALFAYSKDPALAVEARGGGAKGDQKGEYEARRKESARKLKLIGKALHAFHDTYKYLPPAAICDRKTGKPLLSWRVAILPFIEQKNLYQQFKLDEPWDGPHNKRLSEMVVTLYAPPGVKGDEQSRTVYRAFVAARAGLGPPLQTLRNNKSPFGAWGLKLGGILDGTSITIGVVEAAEAVPWAKPEELVYDAKKPLPKLGGLFQDGFHAVMMDGSVIFISNQIEDDSLRALITTSGGEPVDVETLRKRGVVK